MSGNSCYGRVVRCLVAALSLNALSAVSTNATQVGGKSAARRIRSKSSNPSAPRPGGRVSKEVAKRAPARPALVLQTGQVDLAGSMDFSPDGRLLATANGKTVELWDVALGLKVRLLKGSRLESSAIAFSPDGRLLASAGRDHMQGQGEINVWEVASGRVVATNPGAAGMDVGSIVFDCHGALIINGIERWQIRGRKVMRVGSSRGLYARDNLPSYLDMSPQKCLKAIAEKDGVIIEKANRKIVLKPLAAPQNTVAAGWFSSDGNLFVSLEKRAGAQPEWDLALWDVKTERKLWPFVLSKNAPLAITFNGDKSRMHIWLDDDSIMVWDVQSGQSLSRTPIADAVDEEKKNLTSKGRNAPRFINNMAISPGGRLAAFENEEDMIEIFEVATGKKLGVLRSYVESPTGLAVSSDGRWLAVATMGQAFKVWDTVTGKLAFSPSGKLLALPYTNTSLAFSPAGPLLAAGGESEIRFWNTETWKEILSIELGANFAENPVAFSPDGEMLAAAGSLWNVRTGSLIRDLEGMGRHFSYVFSPNGRFVIGASGIDGPTVWEVATGKEVTEQMLSYEYEIDGEFSLGMLLKRMHLQVKINPAGTLVATASNDDGVYLFPFAAGQDFRTLRGHTNDVNAIAFSPDGRLLASAGDDNSVMLWETTRPGAEVITLKHDDRVREVIFSPNGRLLYTASGDGTVNVWETKTACLLASLISLREGVDWLVVTPDGLFDGTADAMQRVSWRLKETNEILPLDGFFNDFYYPGLLLDIVAGERPKAEIDLAMVLQFPGLRTMLREKTAFKSEKDGRKVICFVNEPTTANFSLLGSGKPATMNGFRFDPDSASCKYSKVISKEFTEFIQSLTSTKNSRSESEKVADRSEVANSTLHVMTVGVGKYPADSGQKELPFSVKGAEAIRDFFARQKELKTTPFADIKIKPLHETDATRKAIRQSLADMVGVVNKDDVVLLFFSGHGVVPFGQEMFYFLPVDAQTATLRDYRETGLNAAMLAEALREIPARRIVLIIDACQAGAAVESLAKVGDVKMNIELRREGLTKNSPQPAVGVYIVAAAAPLQYAQQISELGNSSLVVAILEGLKSHMQTDERVIWIKDLVKYVGVRTPVISRQADKSTHPVVQNPLTQSIGSSFPIAVREKTSLEKVLPK